MFNRKRPDVIATTGWLAPVIWEGTYNRQVLDKYYKRVNITIGLAVLDTGKYAHWFLSFTFWRDRDEQPWTISVHSTASYEPGVTSDCPGYL